MKVDGYRGPEATRQPGGIGEAARNVFRPPRRPQAIMVTSRGGISGGLTISDALREFESRGYVGQFRIIDGGRVECTNCGRAHRPREVALDAMRRIEGASDPADMVFVGALECPRCHTRGTAVVNYGPTASPEHAAALRELDDRRDVPGLSERAADDALVSDSGWLKGPDDR